MNAQHRARPNAPVDARRTVSPAGSSSSNNNPDDWFSPSPGSFYGWAIAGAYRALASTQDRKLLPAPPFRGSDFTQNLGYWHSLDSILHCSLGWARPDLGLMWWYDAGKPAEDPRLELIKETWDSDGLLDGYLAWAHIVAQNFHREEVDISSVWTERLAGFTRELLAQEWQYPVIEGSGMHLGPRSNECEGGHEPGAELICSSASRGHATLTLANLSNWYSTVQAEGKKLADLGPKSWRVNVFVKSVGWMGTYRLSRVTGRWFSGKHSVHLLGNARTACTTPNS